LMPNNRAPKNVYQALVRPEQGAVKKGRKSTFAALPLDRSPAQEAGPGRVAEEGFQVMVF
ncbi:MAG: hypothetical protein ACP5DX_18540, partial [Paracoccaceae bacterium]